MIILSKEKPNWTKLWCLGGAGKVYSGETCPVVDLLQMTDGVKFLIISLKFILEIPIDCSGDLIKTARSSECSGNNINNCTTLVSDSSTAPYSGYQTASVDCAELTHRLDHRLFNFFCSR